MKTEEKHSLHFENQEVSDYLTGNCFQRVMGLKFQFQLAEISRYSAMTVRGNIKRGSQLESR